MGEINTRSHEASEDRGVIESNLKIFRRLCIGSRTLRSQTQSNEGSVNGEHKERKIVVLQRKGETDLRVLGCV